ncbi:hypothetical protein AAFF_G00214850, partial [Aldrovandia affinis]
PDWSLRCEVRIHLHEVKKKKYLLDTPLDALKFKMKRQLNLLSFVGPPKIRKDNDDVNDSWHCTPLFTWCCAPLFSAGYTFSCVYSGAMAHFLQWGAVVALLSLMSLQSEAQDAQLDVDHGTKGLNQEQLRAVISQNLNDYIQDLDDDLLDELMNYFDENDDGILDRAEYGHLVAGELALASAGVFDCRILPALTYSS